MRVTIELLQARGASCSELDVFTKEWPQGGKLNKKNILRALELGLNLDWFAFNCLPPSARADFKKATDSAWATCKKAEALARAALQKSTAPAQATYDKADALAWAAYQKACAWALIEVVAKMEVQE